MSKIDFSGIEKRLSAELEKHDIKEKIDKKIDDIVMGKEPGDGKVKCAEIAAQKFIDVMRNEIESHGASGGFRNGNLGSTAVAALSRLDHGSVFKTGPRRYAVEVYFTNNLHRDSLAPDEYDGINNIAALLNSGYSAGHTVYGIWMNHCPYSIPSLRVRDGAHFIENAKRDFMANYAAEYGVTSIDIGEEYT